MSKKWEYTPDQLKSLSEKAKLSERKKKDVMERLLSDALEGVTSSLLFFETIGECRLTKSYLESLSYKVRYYNHPSEENSLLVSWEETK